MKLLSKLKEIGKFYNNANTYKNIDNNDLSELVYKILEEKEHSCRFNHIENVRKSLLKDNRILNIIDFGAGANHTKAIQRTVKSIAKTALSPKWQCELMSNIIKEFNCENILELGTSLGISTSYLANANRHGIVYSFEGAESISSVAMQTFARLQIKNVKLITGNFDVTLPTILENIAQIDFAFIDGNHRYESTVKYFEMILKNSHAKTILVIDDIYWSQGMKQAWNHITNHRQVTASLDFYNFGIIFLNKKYNGNHTVINSKYKIK